MSHPIFKRFAPITKIDEEQRMVFGYASTEALDAQGEVVERAAIEAALPDYMRFANIREMHTMSAVGVAKSADMDDKGLFLGAKIVDDSAWVKVMEGVYKGFSIGGRALEKIDGVIKKLRLTEISLVDRPANPECVIEAWKADALPSEDAPESATPPVAAEADAPVADAPVVKGVYNAQRLIEALACVAGCARDAEFEAKNGEHSPEMVAALKAAIPAMGDLVQRYLGEEIAGMMGRKFGEAAAVQMADAGGDVAKAGARYSKGTKAALKSIHDNLRACMKGMDELGYDAEDDAEKAESGGEVAKADAGALAKLESDLAKVSQERDELVKRVKELESQPAPAKAVTTAVEKSEDTNGNLVADTVKLDPNDPLSIFKAALSRPRVVGGAPISKPSSAS